MRAPGTWLAMCLVALATRNVAAQNTDVSSLERGPIITVTGTGEVMVDPDRATLPISIGVWIDTALSAGASRIEDPQFGASDETAARAQALTLAVSHARADADVLAKAAGGTLGPLRQLSTERAGPSPFPRAFVASVAPRSAPDTHFEPVQLQISAMIIARWSFAPTP